LEKDWMKFKPDEANLRAGSDHAGEIELYDELVAFSASSPEKQNGGPPPRSTSDSQPAIETNREPSFERPQAGEPDQSSDVDLDLAYLLRVTGPLIAPSQAMNSASPLLVCKDCHSRSSSEDMFCVNCGGLLEGADICEPAAEKRKRSEVAAGDRPATSACKDCGYHIEEQEIFCPSCGAVL
jgi:RNA polymerase subunit RPABC4/transcription elongation factor Spt4